jgi:hypothetical protein
VSFPLPTLLLPEPSSGPGALRADLLADLSDLPGQMETSAEPTAYPKGSTQALRTPTSPFRSATHLLPTQTGDRPVTREDSEGAREILLPSRLDRRIRTFYWIYDPFYWDHDSFYSGTRKFDSVAGALAPEIKRNARPANLAATATWESS